MHKTQMLDPAGTFKRKTFHLLTVHRYELNQQLSKFRANNFLKQALKLRIITVNNIFKTPVNSGPVFSEVLSMCSLSFCQWKL